MHSPHVLSQLANSFRTRDRPESRRQLRQDRSRFMAKYVLTALALWCPPAVADLVADWNAIALDTVLASERHAGRAAQAMASVHVTMFEVMSFVEGGYTPRYLVKPPAPLGKSGAAAAAAAAHHVLSELYPERRAALDAALERSLAALDPQERTNVRIWGRQLGAAVHLARLPAGGGSPPDSIRPARLQFPDQRGRLPENVVCP
jgi:hypothetical protein